MPRYLNPPDLPPPASRYSQAVAVTTAFKRVVVSGQLGMTANGTLAEGVEGQLKQAFANFLAVLAAAGLGPRDVVRTTCYVTVPGSVGPYRAAREEAFGKFAPAATYIEVAGLADPKFLVEIEGEAVQEAKPLT